MRICYLSTLLLIIQFSSVCQTHIEGVVYSSDNYKPISGAHILNVTNDKIDFSSEGGKFRILATVGDTLRITFVGFKTECKIIEKLDFQSILLTPEVIQLDEIQVFNLPKDEYEFKREIVKMGVLELDSLIPLGVTPGKPKGEIPKLYESGSGFEFGANENFWPTLTFPMSYFTKKFSKRHKAKRDYYELKASKDAQILNSKKFNKALVTKLTGFKGQELMKFMSFMKLNNDFVTKSTDYEIAKKIIVLHKEYSAKSKME
jgi:hypothetical protein